MNFKSLYDLLIYTYRTTNKANTIPIITGTQAPTVPPTIAGKLSDKDKSIVVVSKKTEITKYSTLYKVICMFSLSNVIETVAIYIIYKEYLSEVLPNRRYTINTLVSIFTTDSCHRFRHTSGWYSEHYIDTDMSLQETHNMLKRLQFYISLLS